MGNVEFLILAIGAVVFFTLLLVSGNTMAIAVRERLQELAVLNGCSPRAT
jgi:putative ABC transport system permease protein